MYYMDCTAYIDKKEEKIRNLKKQKSEKEGEKSNVEKQVKLWKTSPYLKSINKYEELMNEKESIKYFPVLKKTGKKGSFFLFFIIEILIALIVIISCLEKSLPLLYPLLVTPILPAIISVEFYYKYTHSIRKKIKMIKLGKRNLGEELCIAKEDIEVIKGKIENLNGIIIKLDLEIENIDKEIIVQENQLAQFKKVLHDELKGVLKYRDLRGVDEVALEQNQENRPNKVLEKVLDRRKKLD